ncbi:hypothetical protein [Actinophytocola sp.]|uniref:hypothetical protein n=1 Tax=Actinophytocola sp. TaxID=1872138 RepID=UPI002D7F2273|nr:hypothetical protein [Actinophytocola sp.]HET9140429.1 hypothetical protein [Actinophytocola sp.]HEU5109677.1 hypothetical protein [Micromonosporaceae bacterium]
MSVDLAADPPTIHNDAEIVATVQAAESLLSKRFGARITLAPGPVDLGGSERSIVLRVKVATSPFSLPRSLVLKRYVLPPAGEPCDSFVREAVSYQLATSLATEDRVCPELFAHSGDHRLLVMEDLGLAPTLAGRLMGDDARAAERALLSWAHSLGRLHATTAGREADFDALQRRLGQLGSKDPLAADGPTALAELPAMLDAEFGVATSAAALECVERAKGLLAAERHRAFSPSDSCPDNNLITSRGVRFLDFEGGCVRNVLLDAAYLRVPFPVCWCAFGLPAGMHDAMLAGWRAEVRGVWPDLTDDAVLLPRLVEAQMFWVWYTTWQLLTNSELEGCPHAARSIETPNRSAVLAARWRRLSRYAAACGADPVAEHADAVVAGLESRLDGDLSLPLYPAFR